MSTFVCAIYVAGTLLTAFTIPNTDQAGCERRCAAAAAQHGPNAMPRCAPNRIYRR